MIVETYSYIVFISLAAILTRYYCIIVLWTHFVPKNSCFRALAAYRFDSIACEYYHCILIDHRNPFIYGFYHFGSVSYPLLLRNGIFLAHFGAQNMGFTALDSYDLILLHTNSINAC